MRLSILVLAVTLLVGCGVKRTAKAKPDVLPAGKCAVSGVNSKNEPSLIHCRDENGKDLGLFEKRRGEK